jgi:hypothetical protein
MAAPTLSPVSTVSTSKLPATGTAGDVAATLPYGVYSDSVQFLSGAAQQVAYVYKKLGGDILDIEIKADNVYASYEEACLEYSYIINIHQGKNVLSNVLGNTTGSFDYKGELTSGTDISTKFPRFTFDYARRLSEAAGNEVGAGGSVRHYSASFTTINGHQDYDLQDLVQSASSDTSETFYGAVNNNRIVITKVFFKTPASSWRFYGYYGGVNVVGNLGTYGQYADESTFEIVPYWQNILQAMAYEDSLKVRTSDFSYEIVDNRLRLYPRATTNSPKKIWFNFYVAKDATSEDATRKVGIDGVNNLSTIPFANIPYANINSIGKQWIRRFALALSKEILGQVRGKFQSIPIPGKEVQLNASDLLTQSKEEQQMLRDELKEILDTLTYDKLTETDATMVENNTKLNSFIPSSIYTG